MSTTTILDQIIQSKRHEVAERKARRPIEALRDDIAALGRPRNFFGAVTHKKTGPAARPLSLIAEVKKASPSAVPVRYN